MSVHPTSQKCLVSSCANSALYTCPRCRFQYCSIPCYRAHSQRCVDAFAEDALRPLRGVTTSTSHRRSFNNMLQRIRSDTDAPYAGHPDFSDTDSGDDSDNVCETVDGQTAQQPDTNQPPDHSGEPHVLEQLLNSLDEPGRQALFTVLNSAMENACGRDTLSRSSFSEKRSHADSNSAASNTPKQANDVTDTLEMLAEEMETMGLSYDEILSRLPDFLRKDFEHRLHTGCVGGLVLAWTPWWQHEERPEESSSEQQQAPAPLPPLPLSNQLLVPLHVPRQKASPSLQYSLIDILASYAVSMRLCNGDWWGDVFAARSVWQISTVLSKDARYSSVTEVCNAIKNNIVEKENHVLAMQALRDVADVLGGKGDWVARAVYECQCVLEAGLKVAGSGKSEIRKRVRKVGFFVAWSMCQESAVFEQLSRKVLLFAELESGLAEEVKVAARVAAARRAPKITVVE